MPRLLIAVRSAVFAAALETRFHREFDIRICTDGSSALELLLQFQPEGLIMDLILPLKDGFSILRESGHQPKVILALTDFISPYVQQTAYTLGIQHLLLMPTVHTVCTSFLNLYQRPRKQDIATQVIAHLQALDFQSHLDGYEQLCVAIPLYAADPEQKLCAVLYPAIAARLELSDGRNVERSIRNAIASAWKKKDPTVWAKYFPPDASGRIPCPSNKIFLTRIVQLLEL